MKITINHFFVLCLVLLVITGVIQVFAEKTIESFTGSGFIVGILAIVIAGFRLQSNLNSSQPECTPDQKITEILQENKLKDEHNLQRYLPAGLLFLSGVIWIALMQAVRYFFRA
ncbi:hypothetical protein [Jeongeupia naejangsanensis]|uniref:DUF3899 domain-containing protein n=1 Tax=Jeongeupia naejangsanensis TaxID=613195 RepID=A0ABS2BMQ3_9NEIS|nr:hypothetical protein [Jeongeupia naejangsanensis]MBM3116907.1 hypothetical protein [Jeongeupia naejangsanensis]